MTSSCCVVKRNNRARMRNYLFIFFLFWLRNGHSEMSYENDDEVDDGSDVSNYIDIDNTYNEDETDTTNNWNVWNYFHRYLMGSNCILIERGRSPPYQKCFGCEIQLAMNCLSDLRTNVTGNVATDCKIHGLNADYDEACCPVYIQRRKKLFLKFETSGYPTALSCLRKVGCQDTQIYDDLYTECAEVCKNNIKDNIYLTCTAIGSPASTLRFNILLLILGFLVSLSISEYIM